MSIPWSETDIELDDNAIYTRDFLQEATQKNLDRLYYHCDRQCLESDKSDSDEETDDDVPKRYPKRNVPEVIYREEDVSSDDDYIYCDECDESHQGSCPHHGPLIFVEDKKVTQVNNSNFAWDTCPEYLSVCRSGIRGAGLGIWTEKNLEKGLVFGPYKGKIVKSRQEAKESGYAWEIRRSGKVLHYIDGSDTTVSNWMRFVNCATCDEHQTLIAFQYRGDIFYRTYKVVMAYTELFVWYGDEFGEKLGIFRCGKALLQNGESKKCERNGLQSSSIRKCSYSLQIPCQKQGTQNNQLVMNTSTHSVINIRKSCKYPSQKLKFCAQGGKENASKYDVSDKEDFDKNIDFVPEENMSVRDQNKYPNAAVSKELLCKQHKCTHCEYTTKYSGHLRRHISGVHEGKKPYKCEKCDYRATQAGDLRKHIDAVHEGKKPYKCEKCDYRASQACHLRRHIHAVHDGKKRK